MQLQAGGAIAIVRNKLHYCTCLSEVSGKKNNSKQTDWIQVHVHVKDGWLNAIHSLVPVHCIVLQNAIAAIHVGVDA